MEDARQADEARQNGQAGQHTRGLPSSDPGPKRFRGGRPRGSTRDRILDIALDLFTDRGYDKTSLREIADKLGFTKAALYYHFERKEDILLALHLRMHELGKDVVGQLAHLDRPEQMVQSWSDLLDKFIDEVLANRKLFLFHARNHNALEQMQQDEHHAADHDDMEQQLRRVLADPSIPKGLRVRMACSIGAVLGTLMGTAESFADISTDELAGYLRAAVRDLLEPSDAPAGAKRGRRSPGC